MKLGAALVASDLNPEYIAFYPLVHQAWRRVVGVPAILVLIADAIPDFLTPHADDIILFPPIPGAHTAFQAQCVRLLYPSLLEDRAQGGAIVTSDIDMIPMNRPYYTDTIAALADDQFAVLRSNVLMDDFREIAICYNAARPQTWSALFGGVTSLADVRARMAQWAGACPEYDGRHGGRGWNRDQRLLFDQVRQWEAGAGRGRVTLLNDAVTGYRRLDRLNMELDGGLIERDFDAARAGGFSDCHLMRPPTRHMAFNAAVAALPPRHDENT